MDKPSAYRGWEYAKKGDYHKNLDPDWSYTPTYLKKMKSVHQFLDTLPHDAKILDAGCGEGVLVEEYRQTGRQIIGLDLNYASEFVLRGNILNMPFSDESFDVVLLLDVFKHRSYHDQPQCLTEIKRILHGGVLVMSVPNLAHLNSRFNFFFRGKLDRSDIETNHPGERPIWENIKLVRDAGFKITKIKGITLTLPFIYRQVICRKPSWFKWLHDIIDLFAYPSFAMLNIFVCEKKE